MTACIGRINPVNTVKSARSVAHSKPCHQHPKQRNPGTFGNVYLFGFGF
jgi:hypothetical protein